MKMFMTWELENHNETRPLFPIHFVEVISVTVPWSKPLELLPTTTGCCYTSDLLSGFALALVCMRMASISILCNY